MVEGAAYAGSWIYLSQKMMIWGQPRGENVLDTGHTSQKQLYMVIETCGYESGLGGTGLMWVDP